MDLVFYTLLAGLAGAHLFAVLAYFPGEVRKNPLLLLKFWENIVITSYSIHYTKLYDLDECVPALAPNGTLVVLVRASAGQFHPAGQKASAVCRCWKHRRSIVSRGRQNP